MGSDTVCVRAPVARSSRRVAARAARVWPFDLRERVTVHSREIKQILDTCRPRRSSRVTVFLRPGSGRLAVVAGKRVGGAVQRNRARRVLRAAWSEVGAPDRDAVLVARDAIVGAKTQDLLDEMRELMTGVGVEVGG
jgi:ribonuclease P protein component